MFKKKSISTFVVLFLLALTTDNDIICAKYCFCLTGLIYILTPLQRHLLHAHLYAFGAYILYTLWIYLCVNGRKIVLSLIVDFVFVFIIIYKPTKHFASIQDITAVGSQRILCIFTRQTSYSDYLSKSAFVLSICVS